MALIKESDIKELQNKKADAETTIRATSDAYDKSVRELDNSKGMLADAIAEQKTENPNHLESLDVLIADHEERLKLPQAVMQEFDPTGMSVWGELVYEIIDMDFVKENEEKWRTTRAARDQALKDRSDIKEALISKKVDDISDNIADPTDKEKFEKAGSVLSDSYMRVFKSTQEVLLATGPKEKSSELLGKWIIDEIDNSDLVIRFQKEKDERKEAIADSFKRADRQKALLRENHEDLIAEKEILSSDNELIQKEFAEEMGITGEGENVLVKESLERLRKDKNDFNASKALELTRDSLFALDGIIEKIKQACATGVSSIKITGDDISGTQVYSLIDLGYKVTHSTVFNQGRNKDNTVYTIDWTFAPSAS